MRTPLAVLLIITLAVVATLFVHAPHADAEDIIERALDASIEGASIPVGDFTWIEDAGIGVQLPPAPASDTFPRLLAGKRIDSSHSAALWEAGPDGFSALKLKLDQDGIKFGGSEQWPFRPRGYNEELSAHRSFVTMAQGRAGVVIDWKASGRSFALVVEDTQQNQAAMRADELTRELVVLPGIGTNGISPLFFHGRYACVLDGWQRDGNRLRRSTPQGWLNLRVFQVALTDYENTSRLQFELEGKLDAAGFKRSAGMKPLIAGNEGFVGEYYSSDGFVQRIAYARLEGGYMVALMQAPEAQRDLLSAQMDQFTSTLTSTGLGSSGGSSPLMFSVVRNVRVHAWQDGRRVLWGVLFDDGRKQPVLWRQEGIAWTAMLKLRGQTVGKQREGNSNSSRALNPLVDAELREMKLPEGFSGEVELAISVGGNRAKTNLMIK